MINPFNIMKAVEQEYTLKPGTLIKPNRQPRITEARAIAMYMVREMCTMSYPEVGDYFERDHTTVIHNCKKVEKFAQNQYKKYLCDVIIKLMSKIIHEENAA